MSPDDPVRVTDEGRVRVLTLARPDRRNSLSAATLEALAQALEATTADASVRAVVIDAEGPAFSSGHDLKELTAHRNDPDGGRGFYDAVFARCSEVMSAVVRLPQPVIAAVEGVATAAGCQLAASCDLAVAGEKARFCTPGVDIGLFCSTPGVALVRAVQPKAAMELLLTGAMIDAETALRIGLVNRVVAEGSAREAAMALAQRIASRPANVVQAGKAMVHRQRALPLDEAYAAAGRLMVEQLLADEAREGVAAFLEKRAPDWS